MAVMWLVLIMVVGVIAVLLVGSFRTGAIASRRSVVGRPRRRLGAILFLVGIAALLGGQWYALASAPDRLAQDSAMDVRVFRPAPGSGDYGRYLVQFLTFSDLDPESPELVEYCSFTGIPGERTTATAIAVGDVTPAEFWFDFPVPAADRVSCSFGAQISRDAGSMSMSTGGTLSPEGRMTETMDLGHRASSGRFTAQFPNRVFPATLRTVTVVLVDPVWEGVEQAPLAEALASETGDRIRGALRSGGGGPSHRDSSRGAPLIFASLGLWSWLCLVVAGIGSAFLTARPGIGLALFLLLAPFLLVFGDRMALSAHRDALVHEDHRVRASAMAGLQGSLFYGRTGPREVREFGGKRGGMDAETAEFVRAMNPRPPVTKVRKLIGIAGP